MFKHSAKDVPSPAGGTEARTPPPAPAPAPEPSVPATPTPPAAQAMPSPALGGGNAAASIISQDLLIKGGIEGRGEIQLQGKAWGDVKVERLMVGEAAMLEGSVEAVVVEVRGKVVGAITARQVRLLASARVDGDITYEQLSIDNGAQFEGRCIKSKTKSEGPLPQAAPVPEPEPAALPASSESEPVPAAEKDAEPVPA